MKNDCAQKLTISATYLCVCHCGLSTGAQKQKLEKRFQKRDFRKTLCPNTIFLEYRLINMDSLKDNIISKYCTKDFSFSVEKI